MPNASKRLLSPAHFRQRGKTPLYAQLQAHLQSAIESGQLKANEKLPPEREMAEVACVSVNTVKTALHNLELEGYLVRRQGSGTYVSSPESFFGIHRYYAMQKDFDQALERHKKKLLRLSKEVAPAHIAQHFPMGEPPDSFRIERLLFVGGAKTIYTTSWLPVFLFPEFEAIDEEVFQKNSLYSIMAERYNHPCRISKELLSIAKDNDRVAEILGVSPSEPLLYSKLIALSYTNSPVEVRESFILTSNFMLYREF